MKKKFVFPLLVLALAAACVMLIGAGTLKPLGQEQPVQVEEVSLSVCIEMDSFQSLEDMVNRAQVIVVGQYIEQLEPTEDKNGQTRHHTFEVQQVLKGQAPQQIIVSRSYSTPSTYQAVGEQITYQLPLPNYIEPTLGQTTLLFLSCSHSQDGTRYSSAGEPWEVRQDDQNLAETISNWVNPSPDLPDTVETYVMNQAQDTLYHISYPRQQAEWNDFLTGQPWEELLTQIQQLAN